MNFIEQLTAVTLLIDFLLGMTCGMVGGAVYGSALEDSEYSLLRAAPDAVSAGARIIYGISTRDDGYMQSLLPPGGQEQGDDRDDRRSNGSGPEGTEPER